MDFGSCDQHQTCCSRHHPPNQNNVSPKCICTDSGIPIANLCAWWIDLRFYCIRRGDLQGRVWCPVSGFGSKSTMPWCAVFLSHADAGLWCIFNVLKCTGVVSHARLSEQLGIRRTFSTQPAGNEGPMGQPMTDTGLPEPTVTHDALVAL